MLSMKQLLQAKQQLQQQKAKIEKQIKEIENAIDKLFESNKYNVVEVTPSTDVVPKEETEETVSTK